MWKSCKKLGREQILMSDESRIKNIMKRSQTNITKNAEIERDLSPSVGGAQFIAPAVPSEAQVERDLSPSVGAQFIAPAVPSEAQAERDLSPSVEAQFIAPAVPRVRALVLRAPDINGDRETVQACRLAGFETDLLHINQLIKPPNPQRGHTARAHRGTLLDYQFLVIPGGFSYGDDLGAGTLLAKNLTIHLGDQLRHFIDEGRPVLGICNGFQVLVRAGLLPGPPTEACATLTENASAMFECRWVRMAAQSGPCI